MRTRGISRKLAKKKAWGKEGRGPYKLDLGGPIVWLRDQWRNSGAKNEKVSWPERSKRQKGGRGKKGERTLTLLKAGGKKKGACYS